MTSNAPQAPRGAPLTATPALERLLARLRSRLGVLAWMHGIGLVATFVGAWLAFVFVADWALHVPRGVRWFHLAICVTLPLALLWRFALRPWLRRPNRAGLALLIEREHPQLHEVLVSAVQLQQSPPADADPELVQRVLRSAELEAARLRIEAVLDPSQPRRLFALGAAVSLALVLAARTWPEHASIFVARLLGGDQPWPQRTHLELALGAGLEHVEVQIDGPRRVARLPRGSDAPIIVRAIGAQPDDVKLHVSGGVASVLSAGADGSFRTVLRSLQEDVTLHATGGDDRDEDPSLTLIVLEPPDVAALAVSIEPPEYTGLLARTEFDRDVEVLAGSRLSIAVIPSPAEATGSVRILPADELRPLGPTVFPTRAEAPGGPALGFDLIATQSLRYRIELVDGSGFSNPDPGMFSIQVVRDERPQVDVVAPGRNEIETLDRGLVRLLARVDDDFGVAAVEWRASRTGAERPSPWRALELTAASAAPTGPARPNARLAGVGTDIAAIDAGGRAPTVGDQIEIELRAHDARPALPDGEPDPAGTMQPTAIRVRIVGEDDFLRRLQDRLARVRTQAADAETLSRERLRRTGELLQSIESDGASASSSDMTGLVSGQRRLQGDLDALSREFASIVENVLYARLDAGAAGALADLDTRLARVSAKSFPVDAWRDFNAAVRGGQVTTEGVPRQLIGLMGLALDLAVDDSPAAVDALDRATRASDVSGAHTALSEAQQSQARVQQHLAELLDQLAEWDNYQAILTLTRDILTRQKSVRDRIKEASGAAPRSDR